MSHAEDIAVYLQDEKSEPGFVRFGYPVLESEDVADFTYYWLLDLLVRGYKGSTAHEVKRFKTTPIYVPAVERVSYADQLDRRMELPQYFALGHVMSNARPSCIRDSRVFLTGRTYDLSVGAHRPRYPRVVGGHFQWKIWADLEGDEVLVSAAEYCTVDKSGAVVPFVGYSYSSEMKGACVVLPSIALNAYADRRHLWLVETCETLGTGWQQSIQLGVEEPQIKSLFYARSLPVTETGRRRPLLHWVRAHQRRLKDGIDIDVKKHLRGQTEFEIGGLRMKISQPIKI